MRTMQRRLAVGATALLLAASAAPAFADDGSHRGGNGRGTLLSAGIVGSLTTDPVLFGVKPGGADWTVSRSTVKVKANGRFDIKVRDLVLTRTGANPVKKISASLVCNGMVLKNALPAVAYDTEGDARIRGRFDVPDRCLAPAVLLHPVGDAGVNTGVYIGVSGQAD